ncbi:hypothetical protein WDB88_11535 [Thioclava sp. GXIMD4216]
MPNFDEFVHELQLALDDLCVDIAFVQEYLERNPRKLKRHELVALTPVQQSAWMTFKTYENSLLLETAKLLDGTTDVISPTKFIQHKEGQIGWKIFPDESAYEEWRILFKDWDDRCSTLKIFRDENLAHKLARGAGRKRKELWDYKDRADEDNAAGTYEGQWGKQFALCLEGIHLLSWLLWLCAHSKHDLDSAEIWKQRAKERVSDDIAEYRATHAALLDLVTPTAK